MKSFVLIQHGPEIRYLSGLSDKSSSDEVILLANQRLAPEVLSIVNEKWSIQTFVAPPKTRRHKLASYLFALSDSLARRVNRKRGITAFSYSRKVQYYRPLSTQAEDSAPGKWDFLWLNIIVNILTWCGCSFYREDSFVAFLKESGCHSLLIFDHLGGSDYVACNAKVAGLRVDYYLNNHKDLSIRPYVPRVATSLFCWFDCQMVSTLNICRSHKKIEPIGLLRLEPLLANYADRQIERGSVRNILHFCADSRRRPHELITLKKLFDFIEAKELPLKFRLRKNPMDNFETIGQLATYSFVTIVDHGWIWDEKKFINIPPPEAEIELARQLMACDVVSSLPSTTLVEGFFFGKQVICLLDNESPDREHEEIEMKLCIPETVRKSAFFHTAASPETYIDEIGSIK